MPHQTRLSININKVALLRNARGHNLPDVVKTALDLERFGAQGITVHPRPDERHIKKADVYALKPVLSTEFNIEGYPSEEFLKMIEDICPAQCTLVPDSPEVLTSNAGWDTIKYADFLTETVARIQAAGVRVSLFVEPDAAIMEGSAKTGTNRIEFYTGPYAENYGQNREETIKSYAQAAILAHELGLGINAGHDLNLDNLLYFKQNIPHLAEVSIGHALVVDALYFGWQNVVQMYRQRLK